MPNKQHISIKIDYLSIVFHELSVKECIEQVLKLSFDYFSVRSAHVKHKDYTNVYELGSVRVFGDARKLKQNPNGTGCYLVLSGSACDEYFMYRSCVELIQACVSSVGSDGFHLTRLDIAIDDKNEVPYFTMEQLQKKCKKHEYISTCHSHRFIESNFDEGSAHTIYIESCKSNIMFRFFNKDKEVCMKYNQSLDEVGSWKRCVDCQHFLGGSVK
ncbi:MAG: replication initiation factor domain-containing protein [Anaerorhabdus sp.]